MLRTISTDRIYGNPNQPRQVFDDAKLKELAESIQQNGLLQPIKVRPDGDGKFMIVCGERRWRAHQLAGIKTIKADVVSADEMDDQSLAIAAIVENLQRADITPLEEAKAFQRMLDAGLTTEELSKRLGLKQSWRITERTSLLKIRPQYQDLLSKSVITPSQAFEMSRLNPANQDRLMDLIKAGKCDSYNRLRTTASALLETEQQSEMFEAPKPVTEEERRKMNHLEDTMTKISEMLNKCISNNEAVVVKKLNPGRAMGLADQVAMMQKDLARLEKELRKAAVQQPLH